MLYVLYKKWGWLLNRKGACLLQVDVKNGLLLVALNEIKLFYPWSCFYNFASSQKHFNLKGKLHTPTQISLSCSNESLRREVVLKVKVETGCSIEWCVSGAPGGQESLKTGVRRCVWSSPVSIRPHLGRFIIKEHRGSLWSLRYKWWGKEKNNHRKISPFSHYSGTWQSKNQISFFNKENKGK